MEFLNFEPGRFVVDYSELNRSIILNDQEEKTYYLQEVDLLLGQEKPLVLNNEVETKANGKEINSSEELPF